MTQDHSRAAVGTAVAVLLSIASIFAGVGVYVATEHRDAAAWFTSAAGAVIVAVLLSALYFLVFPLFGRRRSSSGLVDTSCSDRKGSIRAGGDIVAGQDVRASGDIEAGWLSPSALDEYLSEINKTMEAHGFGMKTESAPNRAQDEPMPSWEQLNVLRVARYQATRGLFLAHSWLPSETDGQVADVRLHLLQHGHGPLTDGTIKAVEYTLGPKFSAHSIVRNNPEDGFALDVSMWGPMLCLAKVYFDDSSMPILLDRYVDFDENAEVGSS